MNKGLQLNEKLQVKKVFLQSRVLTVLVEIVFFFLCSFNFPNRYDLKKCCQNFLKNPRRMSTVDVIYIRNYPFNLQLAEFGLYHRHISGISHQTLTICLTVFMNKAVIMISCISCAFTGSTYFVTRFTVLPLYTNLKAIHSTKMILRHQQIKQVLLPCLHKTVRS